MLVARSWRVDALMRMMGILFLFVFGGSLLFSLIPLMPSGSFSDADLDFVRFILGNSVFHCGAFVSIWIFLREHQISWSRAFGWNSGSVYVSLAKGVFTGLVALPIALFLGALCSWVLLRLGMEPKPQDVVRVLNESSSPIRLVYFGVVALFFAPLFEEILFRGILFPVLCSLGYPRLALWGTSVLFALTHQNLMSFVPLTMLAVILVKLYQNTQNLIAPIAAHAVFNACNLVLLLIENGWIRPH